jgi:glycine cleavage system H protein
MNNPTDLKYTRNHEWIRSEDNKTAVIGITDFAQGELGDIVFVELEQPGLTVNQDERLGTIEAVKTVSDIFSPVSGEIAEINEKLDEQPEIVNEDPFGDGWMVKITLDDASELEDLMGAEEYEEVIS